MARLDSRALAPSAEWLTLEQASKRLGVHATTLRRWADQGAIDVFLTPGGHRRFLAASLERFAHEHHRARQPSKQEQQWADRAIVMARHSAREQHWQSVYNDAERELSRNLGRRLVGLILQYVARTDENADLLGEAHNIGMEHARHGLHLDRSLASMLETMSFFRATMIEVAIVHLMGATRGHADENTRLLRRIERVIGEVQAGVVELYTQRTNGEKA